jgi:hypothetical protein
VLYRNIMTSSCEAYAIKRRITATMVSYVTAPGYEEAA